MSNPSSGLVPAARARRATAAARRRLAAALVAPAVVLAACSIGSTGTSAGSGPSGPASGAAAQTVSIALSWTPNTDYTGVYVAQALGYYRQRGIDLKIIPYATTAPETLIAHGVADFGFSYQAGVAYAHAAGHDVVAVFAPDQKGTYAISVRANRTDITSPKSLDGKTYAGFGTPDELPELRYVIRHAGGTGVFKDVTLNTSAYEAVYNGQADFTISVVTWDVIAARLVGKPVKIFRFTDYGFPDQYSDLIASSNHYLTTHSDLARKFLAATQQGYAYAAAHPDTAAKILIDTDPSLFPQPQLVYQSQELLASGGYLTNAEGQVGPQSAVMWTRYGDFLYSNGLLVDGSGKKLTEPPDWSTYYTNAYLPGGGS
jgi:ABC-type nitrate/sulfonate/bicarbonate transport system substrate-binding protein